MRRAPREQGISTLLVALVIFILAVVGVAGAAIGRMVAARGDAQRAADSAAVQIAELVRDNGPGASQVGAIRLADLNSRTLGVSLNPRVYDKWTAQLPGNLFVQVDGSVDVPVPRFLATSGTRTMHVKSIAAIGEWVQPETTWSPAKLLFVLDFSGSMGSVLPGSQQTAIDDLKDTINTILHYNLPIEYAAVVFSDGVNGEVKFTSAANGGSVQSIVKLLGGNTASGSTGTDVALDEAHKIIAEEGSPGGGFHVLLVSDGAPNSVPLAEAQANRLRDDFGQTNPELTMWAIHIDWSGGTDPTLTRFMQDMTGTKDKNPDSSYYYRVITKDDMEPAMVNLIAHIGCPIGPLDPAQIETPRRMSVFLRDQTRLETPLEEKVHPTISDLLGKRFYQWDAKKAMIEPSIPVCIDLASQHLAVIARYNRPRVIQ